jgi:ribosomal protein S27E
LLDPPYPIKRPAKRETLDKNMQIEIPCPKCRNTRMKFERPEPLDTDILICFTCGHELGTLGSVKAKMLAAFERMKKQAQQPRKH